MALEQRTPHHFVPRKTVTKSGLCDSTSSSILCNASNVLSPGTPALTTFQFGNISCKRGVNLGVPSKNIHQL